MAIPSADEFRAFLSLADAPIVVSSGLPEPFTQDDAVSYLHQSLEDRTRVMTQLDGTAAWGWLESQREYRRALGIVTGRRGNQRPEALVAGPDARNRDERVRARVARIFQNTSESMGQGALFSKNYQIRHALEKAATRPLAGAWPVECMRAVAEYLDGSAAPSLLQAAREIQGAHDELAELIRRYTALATRLNSSDIGGGHIGGLGFLRRFPSRLGFDPSLMPIRRDDELAPARLFVFRMWRTHHRLFRTPKIEAIAELMGLEGFGHTYDARTIERLCAKFKAFNRRYLDA